jgi:hypothetical protein
MPNCFQLTRKGETEPIKLIEIDEELCKHFNTPVDPKYWFRAWYHIIGLGLAMGSTWDKLREDYPELLEVIDYLDENYTSNAWCER